MSVALSDVRRPVSVLIVGCGAVVQRLHAIALRGLESSGAVIVVAVVDPDEAQSKAVVAAFRNARRFSRLQQALEATEPEIVLVASPAGMHEEQITLAVSRGCNVLCEKPIAPSYPIAKAIADIARASGKLVAAGMTRRFHPALSEARRIIADWPAPLSFRCIEGSHFAWPLASDAAFRRSVGGGGVLMDKGVHVLDALMWLFGSLDITSARDDARSGGVEGTSQIELHSARAAGTVLLSWDHECLNGITVSSSRGELFIDQSEYRFIELREGGTAWRRHEIDAAWPSCHSTRVSPLEQPTNYMDCIRLQWIAMVRAVRFGEPMPVAADAAADVVRLIDHAYARAQQLEEPWLSASERHITACLHWNVAGVN